MKIDGKIIRLVLLLLVLLTFLLWFVSNAGAVGGFILKLLDILSPLFTGLCLAFLMNIILRPLEKLWRALDGKKRRAAGRSRAMRPVCILLSVVLMFGVVFTVIMVVAQQFSHSILALADKIPEYSQKIDAWWQQMSAYLANFALELPEIQLDPETTIKKLTSLIANGGRLFVNTLGAAPTLVSGVMDVFVALVFSIYVLAQKEQFGAGTKRLITALFPPRGVNSILSLASLINGTFTSFVTGQLTEAVILGSLCFLGMLLLRLPYALVISVLIGFTALIPIFGAFIGLSFGVILILLDTPIKALWFVIFFLVLQQVEGNLIYPRVVGKSVGLPAVFTLMAVTVGGSAFGILGMLVSVPTFSVLYKLATSAVDRRLAEKGITEIE